ncbi:MAG: hypothetical protein ACLPVY_09810 [Acidimicrobiia bacterium]
MSIARRLCVLIAVWSALAAVGAVAAHASDVEGCHALQGTLQVSPGLTDVPTVQTVTLAARLSGCPFAGGSGIVGATAQTSPVTCATLTSLLSPTTADFAWADGTQSTASLAFVSVPGSPNLLDLDGTLISGTERGKRIGDELHLRARFARIVRQAFHRQRVPQTRQLERQPLKSEAGNCASTAPVATIDVASSQRLALTDPHLGTVTTPALRATSIPTNAAARATTATSAKTTGSALTAARAAARTAAQSRTSGRPGRRHTSLTKVAVANGPSGTSGNGWLDPATVLFATFLASSVCLFAFLLKPAWLMRLLRRSPRLHP